MSPTFMEMTMNCVAPTQISIFVRRPAGLPRNCRSMPIRPPSTAAKTSLSPIRGSTLTKNATNNPIGLQFFEVRQGFELFESFFDFAPLQIADPFDAETLDVVRSHHRTENDAAAERALVDFPGLGQSANEASGERVA